MTYTNENRKSTTAAISTKDIIAHIKEAEAKQDQLEARNKEMVIRLGDKDREIANLKANLAGAINLAEQYKKLYEAETHKLDHATRAWKSEKYELSETKEALARYRRKLAEEYQVGDKLAWENIQLKEDVKILKKLAKDLSARLKSWQQIAKHQFRKLNVAEIVAEIGQDAFDDAQTHIAELEEDKQILIDENEYLNDLLDSHREIIWRHEDVQKVAKQQPLLYDLSQQLQKAAEMSAYINYADKMDIEFKDIKVDILALDTKDELMSTIGYVLDELSDLEFLLQTEQKADELEDKLDGIEDVCNRLLYPFQLCE